MTFGEGGNGLLELIGKLLDGIQQLERSPDIAATLQRCEVTGTRKSACDCPVRNYLWRGVGDHIFYRDMVRELTVGTGCIQLTLVPEQEGHTLRRLVIDTPANISAFVTQFDKGEHSQLLKAEVTS